MTSTIPEGAWIALYVRSNVERRVCNGLKERNYEHFLPTYSVRRRWRGSNVLLDVPLFPGYVFCRWSASNPQLIVTVPGVVRIVGVGRIPLQVDDREVEAVRRIASSGAPSMPWHFLRAGERVRLVEGPLRGLEGILVQNKGIYVVVNVTLLQRAVAVTVAFDQVVPQHNFCSLPHGPVGGARPLPLTASGQRLVA